AEELTREDKAEIIARAFQVNQERLMSRWPRFVELFEWSRPAGGARALVSFTTRDWRDLKMLSQLAWMEESWFTTDDVVSLLATKVKDYTETDKSALRKVQLEFLGLVLPVYRDAAQRGQIEISTTPFYHPILPLICDSHVAAVSHPGVTLPPRFHYPQDARDQLERARAYIKEMLGVAPVGMWPSEGSVSDEALALAAECGFTWAASDNGVLSRTLDQPASAQLTYQAYLWRKNGHEIRLLFRDHFLSDLIGFNYSRSGSAEAAEHFLGQIRLNAGGRDA